MSLLTTTNELNAISSQFLLYNEGAMAGAPGPAGAVGPTGPQGPQGNNGADSFGTWYYNTTNPPAPEDLFLGPSTLVISYVSDLPGGLTFLRAANELFIANGGTLTLAFIQEAGTFGPISASLLVSAFVMNDIQGIATLTFTYVGGAPIPSVWAVGQPVNVVSIGGAQGPQGPTGPPGPAGGNDWYNYSAQANVDMNGYNLESVSTVGATTITTGTLSASGLISTTGDVSGATIQGTTISGDTVSAGTALNCVSGTLTALNGSFTNQVDIYTDLLAGFGTLQLGSPNPVAANGANLNLNGALNQARGFCTTTLNGAGLNIDGASSVPGAIGFKFGAIPVAGTNTCRLECNAPTSLASIVGVAPLGITLDAGAASNFSSVGPTTVSTAADIILQAANQNVFIQGAPAGGAFCDLEFTNGGSIKKPGGIVGDASGMNISNINQLSGAAGGPGAGVISAANTVRTTAGNNLEAAADVVSSAGTLNYSLNTIGANYNVVGGFYIDASQNLPTGATNIVWTNPFEWNTAGFMSVAAPSANIVVDISGIYEIACNITNIADTSTAAGTNLRILAFDLLRGATTYLGFVNSSFYNQTNANYNQVVQGVVELQAGDIITVRITQTLTGGQSLLLPRNGPDYNCWMTFRLNKRYP